MSVPQYICSQANLPLCKVLDLESTQHASDEKAPLGIPVAAPYTLALLIISVLCAFRMIRHVNSLYASIGKGEMRTFFSLYILANALQFVILGFERFFNPFIYLILAVLQVSFNSTAFFAMFIAGFTIDRIYGIFGMKSATFMRVLTAMYFVTISAFVFLCCTISNDLVVVLTLGLNVISMVFYLIMQLPKLSRTNSDIWAYGILGIILMVFVMLNLHLVLGAHLVALLTEKNLDNLFFSCLYGLMLVMMLHKYWLSTCDFELECLSLKA